MRKTLTDKGVAALKPRPQRYAFPDPELRGHYVRVHPSGVKAFVTVARNPGGKQIWTSIGAADALSIDDAREKAREAIRRVRDGLPALELPTTKHSFASIAEQWLKRHVRVNGLRSEKEITRLLRVHVFPAWKDRAFLAIRRSDVAALLDRVQDDHGARQADYVLNVVRSIMNWYATRHDDYTPPIVRGMRRQNPGAQARARILTDDDIRLIWKQAEANGTFGAIVRTCLLPRLESNPYVFAGRGSGPYRGFSQAKSAFDAKLPDVAPWVIHDLRRTVRSLMSRAGVSSEHAERVMGHAISGVEGVYDRHSYRDEKADVLRKLAALVDCIVNPRENVVAIRK